MGETTPRTVLCLGNPGPEYSSTRHNVGWWLADRMAERFEFGRFRRQGEAALVRGQVGGIPIQLVKPYTYMNRSGRVLPGLVRKGEVDATRDLLVVVDDVALDVGRLRFRPEGSAGGHNGLKSVQAVLGTAEYARLRIGVGAPPPRVDMADWVLSVPPREDRQTLMELLDRAADCVVIWAIEGIDAAMNRCNN